MNIKIFLDKFQTIRSKIYIETIPMQMRLIYIIVFIHISLRT